MPGAFEQRDRRAILQRGELGHGAIVTTGAHASMELIGFLDRESQDAFGTMSSALRYRVLTSDVRDMRTKDQIEVYDDTRGWRQLYEVTSIDADHTGWTWLSLARLGDAP